jgi:TPR repeat protein
MSPDKRRAFDFTVLAIELGSAEAMLYIGLLQINGLEQETKSSSNTSSSSSAHGELDDQLLLHRNDYLQTYGECKEFLQEKALCPAVKFRKHVESGKRLLFAAAYAGSMEANYQIGLLFESGKGWSDGTAAPAAVVQHYFELAAAAGHASAQYRLGRLYEYGIYCTEDR